MESNHKQDIIPEDSKSNQNTIPQNIVNPMKLVQTTSIPTKLEFAEDQKKNNNNSGGK
ncbi:hypothetical protein [Tepidanaerobacter sp. EBM-38]|jgi:hypothetical protein|uniref:hypothetical protein n=1 Tax=Tepidanaerobacter sp. EBM-38 TaxID=1918496 RepID=UPI000A8516EE|nr:hypothetical protein [Tepidanaerobacter sp. EBM-38]